MHTRVLWNSEKDEELRRSRGVGFSDVVAAIEADRILADIPHPKPEHSHQRLLIVEIDGYAFEVPYVTDGRIRFLKTIYPSRKATRKFLRG
jgi:hypothetical protein